MPITSLSRDPETLTLTLVADFPVPLKRLWAAWKDPRTLERFWGPPPWPATFTRHELVPGGRSEYYMTGPKGETSRGYWSVLAVEPEVSFEVEDGFCHPDGTSNDALPGSRMKMTFEATPGGSRFTSVTTFPSLEAMEQLVAMGMLEGVRAAFGQLDEVLADLRDATAGRGTALEHLDATRARITRDVRGPLALVWRAHHEPALLQRWMLGPDGWTMPVCEVATAVGETYRYAWENAADGARFGFTGELLASEPPQRAVTTERMLGTDGPSTTNELVLSPLPGGRTRITLTITYPSAELKEQILATGMVDGMEASYARLESVVEG